jgi:hypothetical protein
MRRTRRSPPERDGLRFAGALAERGAGRRVGLAGLTAEGSRLREQIGQFASSRPWRQNVGTRPV